MKISMLPLRLNCDQDTIEFLMDFTTQLSTNVLLPSSGSTLNFFVLIVFFTDLNLLGNTSEIAAAFDSSAAQSTSRFAYIPEHSSSNLISSTDDKQGNGLTRPTDALLDDCEDPPRHSIKDYLREFSFSPSVTVRLDYQGKRVKTEQGALLGLLIGLSNLHCTQLELKELHNRNGMLGYARCVQVRRFSSFILLFI
uniref:Autophagy-related protein 2 n=1 Tax=Parascaris equorum TaxID=6256 RepID=A0A914RJ02_PAREQ